MKQVGDRAWDRPERGAAGVGWCPRVAKAAGNRPEDCDTPDRDTKVSEPSHTHRTPHPHSARHVLPTPHATTVLIHYPTRQQATWLLLLATNCPDGYLNNQKRLIQDRNVAAYETRFFSSRTKYDFLIVRRNGPTYAMPHAYSYIFYDNRFRNMSPCPYWNRSVSFVFTYILLI